MLLKEMTEKFRPEFNLTTASTFHHLIAVAATCALLWSVIVATIGS
ncbi:MAG: hypothetical protein ABJH63_01440 [Rhizobiaceae bacterium]